MKEVKVMTKKETLEIIRNDCLMKMCLAEVNKRYQLSFEQEQQNTQLITVLQSQVTENAEKVLIVDEMLDELEKERN